MKTLPSTYSYTANKRSLILFSCYALVCALCLLSSTARAAITWDGEGGSNWWFDPRNWSEYDPNGDGIFLPPSDPGIFGPITQDAQINRRGDADYNSDGVVDGKDILIWQRNVGGPGTFAQGDGNEDGDVDSGDDLDLWEAWYGSSSLSDGVVYDPDNDPFFADAASLDYPTGSPIAGIVGSDYGPEHLYRLYLARNTTNHVRLTIKSGDLVIASNTIIGRSGGDPNNQNLGEVVQTGGRFRIPAQNLNLGRYEASGWGNGTYEYRGGILDVAYDNEEGIKLSTDDQEQFGSGGHGIFRMGNPTTGGYVRTNDYVSAAASIDGDGIYTGVATTDFIFENGGTRPIQVTGRLIINNGLDEDDQEGIHSSRLKLTLEEAPSVDPNGVPITLGLFAIDPNDSITGGGDLGNFFSSAEDPNILLTEGATVSAEFGGTTYDWSITYTGDITWTDPNNSVINAITGPGTGSDVVLVGLGSSLSAAIAAVPEPGSLALVCTASMMFVACRRRDRELRQSPRRHPDS